MQILIGKHKGGHNLNKCFFKFRNILCGDDEKNNNGVSVRKYGEKEQNEMSQEAFMNEILEDIASYSREK